MISLIKNEIYKIIKQKKLYIFSGVILLLMCLQYAMFLVLKYTKTASNGADATVNIINGQSFPIMMLAGISQIVVIYIVILIADIIADEYKSGTLKLSILRPVNRFKLMISKLVGVLFGVIVLHLFTLLTSYILGSIFFGWGEKFVFNGFKLSASGDLVTFQYSFSAISGILFTVASYLLMVLPYLAFGMVVLLIATLIPNMGATIGISLGIWVVLSLLNQTIKQTRPYLINNYYNFFMEFAKDPNIKQIITGFIVIILYGVIFFTSSVLVFRKKDILL